MLTDLKCPACQTELSWDDNYLYCSHGPCPSYAANNGARAGTPEEALRLLTTQIEAELYD